ncbi:hypothetical protein D3C72_929550 [compost metagenome]
MLLIDQPDHGCSIADSWPRQYQFRSHHCGVVWHAPGIDVEHGDYRHYNVEGTQTNIVRHVLRHAVQDGTAVTCQHAFGVSRSPRGVAKPAGAVLVQLWPVVVFIGVCNQLFVTEQVGKGAVRYLIPWTQGNVPTHAIQLGLNAFQQRNELRIDEQHIIFSVANDVADLFWGQFGVDGMADSPRAWNRVMQFEVSMIVPGQGAHPRIVRATQCVQPIG